MFKARLEFVRVGPSRGKSRHFFCTISIINAGTDARAQLAITGSGRGRLSEPKVDKFLYNVVLSGQTLSGYTRTDAARDLARLFKRDEAGMLRLLDGRSVTIRSGVEHEMAQRYVEALRRIGVEAAIEQQTLVLDDLTIPAVAEFAPRQMVSPPVMRPVTQLSATPPASPTAPLDFPTEDVEPVYVNSMWDDQWAFTSKAGDDAPPRWTSGHVDLMFSAAHVFLQEHTTRPLKVADYVVTTGIKAAVLTSALAAIAVPVVGLAIAGTALGASKLMGRKKHPGYGAYNQFVPEAMITAFAAGKGAWARRSDCEVRSWRIGNFLEYKYYCAIIGRFHHATGVADWAGACEIVYIGKDYAKELTKATGWTIRPQETFKSLTEAWRSVSGYRPPRAVK